MAENHGCYLLGYLNWLKDSSRFLLSKTGKNNGEHKMLVAIIIIIMLAVMVWTFRDEFKDDDDDEDNESQEENNNKVPVKDIIKQNNTSLKDEFKDKLAEFKLSPKLYLILVVSLTILSIIIAFVLNIPFIKTILFITILSIPLDIMRIRDKMYSGCFFSIALTTLIFINIIIISLALIGISKNDDQGVIIGFICFIIFYKTLGFGESLEGQTESFVRPNSNLQTCERPNQNTYKKTKSDLSHKTKSISEKNSETRIIEKLKVIGSVIFIGIVIIMTCRILIPWIIGTVLLSIILSILGNWLDYLDK